MNFKLIKYIFLVGLFFLSIVIHAQWNREIKTSIGIQLWSTYTMNQSYYDEDSAAYLPVENRWNNQIRRTRIGISGSPAPTLQYKLTVALDLVGRDVNSATQGASNNGNFGQFGLWNMFVLWQPVPKNDLLHIKAGFQPVMIGRESITGALRSTSFEKSWSQNYLRRHIVGRGPGRAMGVNLGGQHTFNDFFALGYDTGLFTPQAFTSESNTQGIAASPLWVGRLVMYLGDKESGKYSTGHKINYFGKRNGLSVALASSYQGKTDIFSRNQTFGFDWLFNYGMFNLDGEWTHLYREKGIHTTHAGTGYIRVGYNIPVGKNEQYIEPVVMWTKFQGPLDLEAEQNAVAMNAFAGTDQIIEIGANYHINSNAKITFNYTRNRGNLGDYSEGATFNNFYRNSDKTPIQRGDLIGLAFVGIF